MNPEDVQFDFISPKIEIRPSPGKGRGFFAKEDIPKNELIMVSKALVMIFGGQHCADECKFITKQLEKNEKTYPKEHMEAYYSLYVAPDHKKNLVNRFNYNGFRAVPRLDVAYNQTSSIKNPDIGLFTYLSYFNHSCVPNCFKFFIKDQAFVRTAEDVKKDEELFVNYVANEQNFFNLRGRTA